MDVDGFIRDGYVAVRGAVDAGTAAACRELIWESMASQGVRRDELRTWPSQAALTATWPHYGTAPRMIAQPALHVADGFAIDGANPSPVAQAIVAGLAMA